MACIGKVTFYSFRQGSPIKLDDCIFIQSETKYLEELTRNYKSERMKKIELRQWDVKEASYDPYAVIVRIAFAAPLWNGF